MNDTNLDKNSRNLNGIEVKNNYVGPQRIVFFFTTSNNDYS